MVKLQPCPFCGGEAEIVKNHIYGYVSGYIPYCQNCGCELKMFKTKQAAENAWNRRKDAIYQEQIKIKAGEL